MKQEMQAAIKRALSESTSKAAATVYKGIAKSLFETKKATK